MENGADYSDILPGPLPRTACVGLVVAGRRGAPAAAFFWMIARVTIRLACGLLCALAWPPLVLSAAGAPRTEAYGLRHAAAHELEPTLLAMLGAWAAQAQVSVDRQQNQLLVVGPPAVQEVARQLVAALDVPGGDAAPATAPVLQAYPFRGADLKSAATRLEAQLQSLEPAARVTGDERTAQLLVWAAAATQREAAERLALLEAAPARQATPGPEAAERFSALPLAHHRVDQVEVVLREMFAGRLWPQPDTPAGAGTYQLQSATGRTLRLVFDQRTNQVLVQGSAPLVSQFATLLAGIDVPGGAAAARVTRVMALGNADLGKVRQAIDAYRQPAPRVPPAAVPGRPAGGALRGQPSPEAESRRMPGGTVPSQMSLGPARVPGAGRVERVAYQAEGSGGAVVTPLPEAADGGAPGILADELGEEAAERRLRSLGTEVEVESLPDLDVVILRGNQRDVDEVVRIIQEIERLSAESEPTIEVLPLAHVGSEKLAAMVNQLKLQLLANRQGNASVTALVKPNALLMIGWGEALVAMRELVARLDQPVEAASQLHVFPLKHAAAATAQKTVEEFFAKRTGLGTKVLVTADVRANALLVQADQRDLAEVQLLIEQLDVPRGAAANELRVIKLKNTLAGDLGPVLQAAISGSGAAASGPAAAARSAVLKFLTIDAEGRQVLASGILGDVRITPDPRTNTLLISAPAETLELIAALVAQLDAMPAASAEIKVFTIVNGDAAALVEMLRSLLDDRSAAAGLGPQLAGAEGEESLAPLRFSVDTRTNSIIASGSAGELNIVEAILLRLDQSDSQERKSIVFRLKNAPAANVAESINEFLRSERVVQQAAPGSQSPFRRIESEVVVVPEFISNSLIISATPRYFDEIKQLVEDLDAQPPQVLVQVLIAEVRLNKTDEFGVELGLQDSLLFDRGLLSGVTTTRSDGNGDIIDQSTNPTVSVPGFNFNSGRSTLGNSQNARALRSSDRVGGQGLSNFNVGRINEDLGFGGLVLSASSESVSILLRALRARSRVDILSRPQVMTLDNQPAFIQVGQRVPRITATQLTQFGSVNGITLENVGLILGVTPRISPDGLVVMEVDAEKSAIDRESPGIAVGVTQQGNVLTQPIFTTTTAQTTVSAASGQTIVLGGLITNEKTVVNRRVPYLSDIPLLGSLFRYDLARNQRSELLIILTPHIVRNQAEAERLKQLEAARMSWCLADVEALHGPCAICRRGDCEHRLAPTEIIYPDVDPRGVGIPFEEIEEGPELLPDGAESPTAPVEGESSRNAPPPANHGVPRVHPTRPAVAPAVSMVPAPALRTGQAIPTTLPAAPAVHRLPAPGPAGQRRARTWLPGPSPAPAASR